MRKNPRRDVHRKPTEVTKQQWKMERRRRKRRRGIVPLLRWEYVVVLVVDDLRSSFLFLCLCFSCPFPDFVCILTWLYALYHPALTILAPLQALHDLHEKSRLR